MTNTNCILVLCTILSFRFVTGQGTDLEAEPKIVQQPVEVSDLCLGCICEAISDCDRSLACNGDVCGLFRITWAYWADAGKNVLQYDSVNNTDAWVRCVTEPFCAAQTVRGYMNRFAKDCNRDGKVDCLDFAAIHRLGGYGCEGNVDFKYYNKFLTCHQQVTQQGK